MLFIPSSEDVCFRYKTNIGTHCICNSTISIPATCFGYSIAIIRQYDTPSYLKHVTIWYSYSSNVHLYHTDILSYVCAMSHAVKRSETVRVVHLAYCSHLLQLQRAIYGSKLIVDSCVLLWTLKQYSRHTFNYTRTLLLRLVSHKHCWDVSVIQVYLTTVTVVIGHSGSSPELDRRFGFKPWTGLIESWLFWTIN
jgi:hypothetical protein